MSPKQEAMEIVDFLNEKYKNYPDADVTFSLDFERIMKRFLVICSSFDVYMFSQSLLNWRKIVYKKYPNTKVIMCYRSGAGKIYQTKIDKDK